MSRHFIFDTSVWVHFLNQTKHTGADLLEEAILKEEGVFLTPTILQEILQGIREDTKYEQIKQSLSNFSMLELPHLEAAIGAANLYRGLRKKGITIRKSNDCMIAYYAISYKITLVHNDGDFDQIARHTKLKVWGQG